jgi:hypothetical protein
MQETQAKRDTAAAQSQIQKQLAQQYAQQNLKGGVPLGSQRTAATQLQVELGRKLNELGVSRIGQETQAMADEEAKSFQRQERLGSEQAGLTSMREQFSLTRDNQEAQNKFAKEMEDMQQAGRITLADKNAAIEENLQRLRGQQQADLSTQQYGYEKSLQQSRADQDLVKLREEYGLKTAADQKAFDNELTKLSKQSQYSLLSQQEAARLQMEQDNRKAAQDAYYKMGVNGEVLSAEKLAGMDSFQKLMYEAGRTGLTKEEADKKVDRQDQLFNLLVAQLGSTKEGESWATFQNNLDLLVKKFYPENNSPIVKMLSNTQQLIPNLIPNMVPTGLDAGGTGGLGKGMDINFTIPNPDVSGRDRGWYMPTDIPVPRTELSPINMNIVPTGAITPVMAPGEQDRAKVEAALDVSSQWDPKVINEQISGLVKNGLLSVDDPLKATEIVTIRAQALGMTVPNYLKEVREMETFWKAANNPGPDEDWATFQARKARMIATQKTINEMKYLGILKADGQPNRATTPEDQARLAALRMQIEQQNKNFAAQSLAPAPITAPVVSGPAVTRAADVPGSLISQTAGDKETVFANTGTKTPIQKFLDQNPDLMAKWVNGGMWVGTGADRKYQSFQNWLENVQGVKDWESQVK